MKKLFLTLLFFVVAIFSISCSPTYRLEKALEELNTNTYTMDGEMVISVTVNQFGYSQKNRTRSNMHIEADVEKCYVENSIDGFITKTYAEIAGDNVDIYTCVDRGWDKSTQSLDDYLVDSDISFLNINIKNAFIEEEDGLWVGNSQVLTGMMKEMIIKFCERISESAGILSYEVTKYNIKITEKKVSNLDIEMNMVLSIASATTASVRIRMDYDVINIGSTVVTVPTDLDKTPEDYNEKK